MTDRPRVADPSWRLAHISEFSRRAEDWDRLVSRARFPPFLRAAFLQPALQEFGTGDEKVAVYGSDADPAAMAIVTRTGPGRWQTFQPSQLPLGAFVCESGLSIEETLQRLLRSLPGVAVMFSLTQQDPALVDRPPLLSRVRALDYLETAKVMIRAPFDSYWASRGKNLRTNVKRQLAKLSSDGRVARLDVIDKPADVLPAIAEYARLEASGWKQMDGTAVAADNAQGRFYVRMLEAFCQAGKGRIYRYLIDNVVAAMDLSIQDDEVVVILKTAYNDAFSSVSPATLMRYEYFRSLFDKGGIQCIEFYGKVMEWHRRWTEDVRMLYHLNVYRTTVLRTIHERIMRAPAKSQP